MNAGRIITRACLGILAIEAAWVAFLLIGGDPRFEIALDYRIYHAAAESWLAGDGFYLPRQLDGPYVIRIGDILYPPVILWLLVPFVYLPAALWWLIPVGVMVLVVWKLRPTPLGWLLIVALCLYPRTPQIVIHGNPTMWLIAFSTAALIYAWPGPFVLMKPILAPFALIGIRRRAWWVGLAVFVAMCLPFGAMWADWLEATLNSGGAIYALGDFVPMLLPIAIWFGRTREPAPIPSLSAPLPEGMTNA